MLSVLLSFTTPDVPYYNGQPNYCNVIAEFGRFFAVDAIIKVDTER